jgi:hypothetical protein
MEGLLKVSDEETDILQPAGATAAGLWSLVGVGRCLQDEQLTTVRQDEQLLRAKPAAASSSCSRSSH